MSTYQYLRSIVEKARNAWKREVDSEKLLEDAIEHLVLVCEEVQRNKNILEEERALDVFRNVSGLVRSAVHYSIECENGCFDDARFYLRKIMEFFVILVAIGYSKELYDEYLAGDLGKTGKGFSYVLKKLLKTSNIPSEEMALLRWFAGEIGNEIGVNQYSKLSESTVHAFSKKELLEQESAQGFKMDINEATSDHIRSSINNAVILIMNAAGIVLGIFEYIEFINATGITDKSLKLRNEHNRIRNIIQNPKNKLF